MKWMQLLMGRSEKKSGGSVEMLHMCGDDGKLEIRGGWLVERRAHKRDSWYSREKRQSQRFRDGQRVCCYPVSSQPFDVQVIDASLSGLRIKTDASLTIGSHTSLVLKFGKEIGQFYVKILWQGIRQGSYEYGVMFSTMDQKNNNPLRRYIAHLQARRQIA